MSNRFATAKARLANRLIGRGAETVQLMQDGQAIDVDAVIAPITLEVMESDGSLVRREMMGFVCKTEDLGFAKPVPGMRIKRMNDDPSIYEVASPGAPKDCFEYLADRNLVRLFAVRIR